MPNNYAPLAIPQVPHRKIFYCLLVSQCISPLAICCIAREPAEAQVEHTLHSHYYPQSMSYDPCVESQQRPSFKVQAVRATNH